MPHPFTDTYIAMAKAAEEIQAMRAEFANGYGLPLDILEDDRNKWWLPRLDQLLGMLGGPLAFASLAFDCDPDGIFLISRQMLYGFPFPSSRAEDVLDWHELALAVVMREKYGKIWNGKGWVKL